MAKSDLISREDAINAVAVAVLDDRDELEAIKALPSADAVSREDYEKIKNMVSTQFQTVLEDYLELEKRYVALLGKQSQKPSAEAKDDLISRSALMEYCSNQKSKSIDNNDIARFPSAEAVQGEWILVKGSNGKDYHKCSKCLHTQEITGVKNYCAVCGARMKGGDTE